VPVRGAPTTSATFSCSASARVARPRGGEQLVVDEGQEIRTVGRLTCDFVLARRSGKSKAVLEPDFLCPHGPKSRFPPPKRDGTESS
jgi:hypothetical protein